MANSTDGIEKPLVTILKHVWLPYNIIVSFIGVPGNLLTILMLTRRSLLKNFNSCTLVALGK